MVKISYFRLLFIKSVLGLIVLSFNASAQQAITKKVPNVEYYKDDNVTNQIPYFDNRFRIDALIDELTLLFYRKSGSKPVILIRPDGSKLRIDNVDKERVEWFDDATFDMIRIKKPMPGPWQAVGDIQPNSKIMVMSDVRLEVEPLPEIVLSGETIKVTGQLFNGEKAIDNPMFRDVIQLDIDFYSTNNSSFVNFGADAIKISSFRDDGHELDEHSGDNIFTGEFNLDFAAGEWQPVYIIKLPMATREVKQKTIVLHPTPVSLSVDLANIEGEFHQVHFHIDGEFVDVDSLIFQGNIRYPDKQSKPFSIMEEKGDSRTIEVEYTEPGIYRVSVRAFGQTTNGREFRLVVDDFSFNVSANDVIVPLDESGDVLKEGELVNDEINEEKEGELFALELAESLQELKEQEALKQKETIIAIVVANISIIGFVFLGFVFIRWRKSKVNK